MEEFRQLIENQQQRRRGRSPRQNHGGSQEWSRTPSHSISQLSRGSHVRRHYTAGGVERIEQGFALSVEKDGVMIIKTGIRAIYNSQIHCGGRKWGSSGAKRVLPRIEVAGPREEVSVIGIRVQLDATEEDGGQGSNSGERGRKSTIHSGCNAIQGEGEPDEANYNAYQDIGGYSDGA
ncbi:unnamed protein product [Sphenostylis stenocarpa]|uniref:Uncharacterized protein n=1 Tax=Sphenostylis stenocarpa TaxID=92480 RepID=A0AA86VTQ9_9FABA|nr:unnamed protein product [Sphenostylis stenocarpa]